MFSIKNLIESETNFTNFKRNLSIPTVSQVDLDHTEARKKVLERANTMKVQGNSRYLRKLKSRLTFATFKVEHGWESRSFAEVKQLYQETYGTKESITSHNSLIISKSYKPQESEFMVPRIPISTSHKRKFSEEFKQSKPLTLRPTFSSNKNIQDNKHPRKQPWFNSEFEPNQKPSKEPPVKSMLRSKSREADKENQKSVSIDPFATINTSGFTTPPRSSPIHNSIILDVQEPPCKPSFLSSVKLDKFSTHPENLACQPRSTSPALEAAETIMMLSSPRPSTPVTPRCSPQENSPPPSSSLEMHPVQHTYQEGIFSTTKDSLNLLVATASCVPK